MPHILYRPGTVLSTLAQDANHPKIITRDVKPENFLVGLPGSPTESIIHMVHDVDIRGYGDCVCANTCVKKSMPMTNCDDMIGYDLDAHDAPG